LRRVGYSKEVMIDMLTWLARGAGGDKDLLASNGSDSVDRSTTAEKQAYQEDSEKTWG
jgi:hypothetical protein